MLALRAVRIAIIMIANPDQVAVVRSERCRTWSGGTTKREGKTHRAHNLSRLVNHRNGLLKVSHIKGNIRKMSWIFGGTAVS